MKKFISAASIGQFREIVANINRTANFVGLDDNGKAIYDPSLKKPILEFKGTVKLHGTFAAVCYNEISGLWVQSKNEIITPSPQILYKTTFEDDSNIITDEEVLISNKVIKKSEKLETHDNCGFAFFVESRKDIFIKIIKSLAEISGIDLMDNSVVLGMEWAGKGIQKAVGISEIDKSAFILSHAKISPFDQNKSSYWICTNKIDSIDDGIYNLENFKTFSIEIDFNNPQLFQNTIIEMTIKVEDECPVSKEFGHPETIGEGIVFSHLNEDGSRYIFKSKGEKHSAKSKVKTLKPVDDEKINKCMQIAEQVTPSWRLSQMITETFDTLNGGVIDRSKIGEYLRAVMNDVVKEDSDIISDAGLELKDVGKYISVIARDFFFQTEREDLGV